MSSEVRDNGQVATDRLRLEYSVIALRNYSAFEFAREALAEFGVILTITEADKLLRENREIKEQALVSLIPRVQRGLPKQAVNDALKLLDAEWEMLSSQLWRAWKFGDRMVSVYGAYDISFEESLDAILRSEGEIATHNSAVTTSPDLFIFGTTSQPGHQNKEQARKHGYDGVKKKISSQQARKHGYSNANVMGCESATANVKEVQMPKLNSSTMATGDGSNKVPQEHDPRVCDEGVIYEPPALLDGLSNANVMGSEIAAANDKEVQVPKPNPSTRATGDGSQERGPRTENVDGLVDEGVIVQDSNDDAEVVDDDWVNLPDANVKLEVDMEIASFKAILEEQRKALDLVKELEQHVQNAQVQRAHLAVQRAYDEVQRAHDEAAHKVEQLTQIATEAESKNTPLDELH